MRTRLPALLLAAIVAAIFGFATVPAGASAGGNGKGKSGTAHANHGPQATSSPSGVHDPSNPDGTYRGKSPSKPDQDGIGADHGLFNNDKVGPGTDGNNGCGNDADREDDDNGWCGNKPAHVKPTPTPGPTGSPTVTPSPTVQPTSGGNNSEVLGETFTRSPQVAGRILARTGVAIAVFVVASLVLMGLGSAFKTLARARG